MSIMDESEELKRRGNFNKLHFNKLYFRVLLSVGVPTSDIKWVVEEPLNSMANIGLTRRCDAYSPFKERSNTKRLYCEDSMTSNTPPDPFAFFG